MKAMNIYSDSISKIILEKYISNVRKPKEPEPVRKRN